jgi:hypothetical protein
MVAHDQARKEIAMLVKTKKVMTVALAAAALTTASLALAGDAFAGGGRHGRNFHFHRGGVFLSTPVTASCWKWINFKKVWICG